MRSLEVRRRALETLLQAHRPLWHARPFREAQPEWCQQWPVLAAELTNWPEARVEAANADSGLALQWLASHFPALSELSDWADFPVLRPQAARREQYDAGRWARDIPGRKLAQIEAFVAASQPGGDVVIDWCGGKGHLGRLLAWQWRLPVRTLEIDAGLCAAGETLALRLDVDQKFITADALTVADWPRRGQHAVALHACGDLHRHLLRRGAQCGVRRFDVAPCCYHLGVAPHYLPLATGSQLELTRDDVRLAVTETVTASPRLVRRRDQEMAWKLAFDACRQRLGQAAYRPFKPVPAAWFRGSFADFLGAMLAREGMPATPSSQLGEFEYTGWQRQREVMRHSVVRHAFRQAIEAWLVLDLALYLEGQGYGATIGRFCDRRLTPRNLLLSAEKG